MPQIFVAKLQNLGQINDSEQGKDDERTYEDAISEMLNEEKEDSSNPYLDDLDIDMGDVDLNDLIRDVVPDAFPGPG